MKPPLNYQSKFSLPAYSLPDEEPINNIEKREDEIRVMKAPPRSDFFMTSLTLKSSLCFIDWEKEIYIIKPELMDDLKGDAYVGVATYAITTKGDSIVLVSKKPFSENDTWGQSRMEYLNMSKNNFIRVTADMENNIYKVITMEREVEEPEWPTESFEEILTEAFKDRIIDSMEHPVIQELLGK